MARGRCVSKLDMYHTIDGSAKKVNPLTSLQVQNINRSLEVTKKEMLMIPRQEVLILKEPTKIKEFASSIA